MSGCVSCKQVSGFVSTMGRVAKTAILTGIVWNESLAPDRMKTCGACDKFDASSSTCKECGCNMLIKAKLVAAKCPLGKWA
jgi:hypothetical protein